MKIIAEEERRMTLLEMQVGALLQRCERYEARVRKLREYLALHGPHAPFEADCADNDCPTCEFLKKDAAL